MKKRIVKAATIIGILIAMLLVSGCATFSVKPPPGMYLSTGDYVDGVKTMGILQVNKSVFAPLFIYNINNVRRDLYYDLIRKGEAVNADGITNIQFYWKLSPFTYLSMMVASGIYDFYMEGVAIEL